MTEEQLKETAAQLRQPHGEGGLKTADWMSKGNRHIIADTLTGVDAGGNDHILELGMANGYFVKDILTKSPSIHYTGCDFSELMVGEARKLNAAWIENKRADFICADFSSIPLPEHSFDKVFTVNTIYFWENRGQILSEIKRVLKPSGMLIIGLRPKRQTEKYPFTKYGFNLFSKEEVVKLLSENSFTVVSAVENNEPDMEVNGQIMKMENLVVRAQQV